MRNPIELDFTLPTDPDELRDYCEMLTIGLDANSMVFELLQDDRNRLRARNAELESLVASLSDRLMKCSQALSKAAERKYGTPKREDSNDQGL
jgi:hypothetical protein